MIGAGLDRQVPEPDTERLAEWLGAEYEPFGAHSHYGLVVGEKSYQQVAEAIRGVPRDQPPLAAAGGVRPAVRLGLGEVRGPLVSSAGPVATVPRRPPAPHSSRGPGHRPLKAEITGSNPVCGTNLDIQRPDPSPDRALRLPR